MFYNPDPRKKRGILHALLGGLMVGMVNIIQPRDDDRWEFQSYRGELVDDPGGTDPVPGPADPESDN